MPIHVCLDPGHGAPDPGCVYPTNSRSPIITEANVVLELALAVETTILQKNDIVVTMTRRTDHKIPLSERGKLAGASGAQLNFNLHMNAAASAEARGMRVYHWPGNEVGREVATALYAAVPDTMKAAGSGVIEAVPLWRWKGKILSYPFSHVRNVLRPAPCPSVLIEAGFLSNQDDRDICRSAGFHDIIGSAILAGVHKFAELTRHETEQH